jgi:S1-C subfamily serine protease
VTDKLVISRADIEIAEARHSIPGSAGAAALTVLAATAAASAVVLLGVLFSARPVGPLAGILGAYLDASRGAALAGGAAVLLGGLALWAQRVRGRRLSLFVPALLAVLVGITGGALGATSWRGAAAFGFSFTAMPPLPADVSPAVRRIQRATAAILAPDERGNARIPSLGTGTVVHVRGGLAYIVTCSHVAMPYAAVATVRDPRHAPPVWVELAGGHATPARVVWAAVPPIDVALLEARVDGAPEPVEIAADTAGLDASAEVLFVPNPFRDGWVVRRGSVQRRQHHDTPAGGVDLLYTDLPVLPGDSGSGLYDAGGRLVGVNTWTRFGGDVPQGISLPVEVLRQVLDAVARGPGIPLAPTMR